MSEGSKPIREVARAAGGAGWAVTSPDDDAEHVVLRTKVLAVQEAITQLRAQPTGGTLRVYYGDGRLESERAVTSTVRSVREAPAPSRNLEAVARRVDREGETVDKGLEAIDFAFYALGLVGVSGLAALISPEVQGALGDGWFAVFLATLTWSGGWLIGTVVVRRSGLAGWPLVVAVLIGFGLALLLASWLGTGALDVTAEIAGNPQNPAGALLAFAEVALRTYGPLGALVGAGVGLWLGLRASEAVPAGFLQ